MFGLGLPEIIIIVVVLGIFLFGGKRMIEFARSIGRVSGEFKKSKKEMEDEIKKGEEEQGGENKDTQ